MCTLTFVPNAKKTTDFIVTSNRDESAERGTIPPKKYTERGVEMLYPKDEVAGGTWIGASAKKRLVCLMNGGFTAHKRKKIYGTSRGVIVKKLLSAEKTTNFMEAVELETVEPFTIIAIDWVSKLEIRKFIWDGTKKHMENLAIQPHIWSASMLYSEETKQKRKRIFEKFLRDNPGGLTRQKLLDFHQKFKIDREFVKTTSITQFVHTEKTSEMVYTNLQNGKRNSIKSSI